MSGHMPTAANQSLTASAVGQLMRFYRKKNLFSRQTPTSRRLIPRRWSYVISSARTAFLRELVPWSKTWLAKKLRMEMACRFSETMVIGRSE